MANLDIVTQLATRCDEMEKSIQFLPEKKKVRTEIARSSMDGQYAHEQILDQIILLQEEVNLPKGESIVNKDMQGSISGQLKELEQCTLEAQERSYDFDMCETRLARQQQELGK